MEKSINYIGELLWPGYLGHFFIVLGFITALVTSYSLYQAFTKEDKSVSGWFKIGKYGFITHSLSIIGAMIILFYLCLNQHYEYNFVFDQINPELTLQYIFVAFWEGQEGSFLLWMFFLIALSWVVWFRSKSWRTGVVASMMLIEVFFSSMLLGVYLHWGLEEYKIGSSPFALVRDLYEAPIFNTADYLQFLPNMANGLNILLQNYWMTIHPPTLFLGFAATAVPMSFALASLWKRSYQDWLKPALPYALFAGGILGLGILMGSAWAYEALSFGGYWAWDPVENTSFVPWLVIVAGIHTNLISRNTGQSVRSTYVFYFLALLLTLYSTFLTRSGILGDSSVHSFTKMGLEWQLLIGLLLLVGIIKWPLIRHWKHIQEKQTEEHIYSKEFWMFIGALVLVFSGFLITFTTSVPVFNKIFEVIGQLTGLDTKSWNMSSPADPMDHFNRYQIWIAVFIAALSGLAQYLRYHGLNWKQYRPTYFRKILTGITGATLVTLLVAWWLVIPSWPYYLLLFCSAFTLVINIEYLIFYLKFKTAQAASVLSHIGFGLFIIGILGSGLNMDIISKNTSFLETDLADLVNEDLLDNVYLVKGIPQPMRNYTLIYKRDTVIGFERFYEVDIFRNKSTSGAKFTVRPSVVYEKDFSNIASANPSVQRKVNQDLFTLISSVPIHHQGTKSLKEYEDSLAYHLVRTVNDEQQIIPGYQLTVGDISYQVVHPEYKALPGDVGIMVRVELTSNDGQKVFTLHPAMVLRENVVMNYADVDKEQGVKVKLDESILDELFTIEKNLDYEKLVLKEGQSTTYHGLEISFDGFNRNTKISNSFKEQEITAAVAAELTIVNPNTGKSYSAAPVFLIKDLQTFNIKEYIRNEQLHVRFTSINPQAETAEILIAKSSGTGIEVPLLVNTKYESDNFILLQAKLFPGINLFWFGGLMMCCGLFFGIWNRFKKDSYRNIASE